MDSVKSQAVKNKDNVMKRLKRIEGQVKGIQKMVEADTCCTDVLTQVAAVRAALNKVGGIILENYSMNCLQYTDSPEEQKKAVQGLTQTIQSFLKFVD